MSLETYFIILSFVFGAIIGSFLNVVIYRLHTGRSLNDRSHCLSCQKQLRWYELFPVFSYFTLRGRCAGCGSYIPARYALVEVLTGCSFLYLYLITDSIVVLALLGCVVSVLIVGVVYDIYHMIIPNEIPIILTVISATLLGFEFQDQGLFEGAAMPLIAGLIASGFYAALWFVSRGRWLGLGDAKLAFPLGLLLSTEGVFSMLVLSFWVGAAVALGALATQAIMIFVRHRRYATGRIANYAQYLTMKSEIPFAPFLVTAFVLVYFFGVDVLTLTEYVISSFI